MTLVTTCTYDARGQLIRPSESEVRSARFALDFDTGEKPTFDRGSVHFYAMTTSGLSAEHARERAKEMLARFFEHTEAVDGYRKIEMRRTQGIIRCNHNVSITYEILYAVENDSRARSHASESRYARHQRDPRAAAFG